MKNILDPRERFSDPEETNRIANESERSSIFTAMPVIIKKHDRDKNAVHTQISTKLLHVNEGKPEWKEIAKNEDIPIYYPGGGGAMITFPVQDGDEGLMVCASRSIDKWWSEGGVQEQLHSRMHDVSDGFCFPGFYSQPNKVPNVSEKTLQIRTKDGTSYIDFNPATASSGVTTFAGEEKPKLNIQIEDKVTVQSYNGAMDVKAKADLITQSVQGKIDLKGQGSVTLKSDGSTVTIQGNGIVNVFGPEIILNGPKVRLGGPNATRALSPNVFVIPSTGGGGGGGSGGGGSPGPVPPVLVEDGTFWWDSISGQLFVWYDDGTSAQWVIANNIPGPQGPPGPAGTSDVIAGTGITITGTPQTISLSIPVAIAHGGTGATTAGQAITNLGGLSASGGSITGSLVISNNLGVNGNFGVIGSITSNYGLYFTDRSVPSLQWAWYAQDSRARLYLNTLGDIFYFNNSGQAFFNNKINIAGQGNDPLVMSSPSGGYCRTYMTVAGARSWTTGVWSNGSYIIADESASAIRFSILVNGEAQFNNRLVVASTAPDPVYLYSNGNCRVVQTVNGVRTWSAGVVAASGEYVIVDETGGGTSRFSLTTGGDAWFPNNVFCSQLVGGPNNAGNLKTWGTYNSVCFRWNGADLLYRIDEALERTINTTVLNVTELDYVSTLGGPTDVQLIGKDEAGISYGIFVDIASDVRIKHNIEPTRVDALSVLQSVSVSQFDLDARCAAFLRTVGHGSASRARALADAEARHVAIGLVAQDIQKYIPEAVGVVEQRGAPDDSPLPYDMHSVIQQNFVPYLIRAVQQLSEKVEQLTARLAKLETT